jgi:hypothetical protein
VKDVSAARHWGIRGHSEKGDERGGSGGWTIHGWTGFG